MSLTPSMDLNPFASAFTPSPSLSVPSGSATNVSSVVYASPDTRPQKTPPGKFGSEPFRLRDYSDFDEAPTPDAPFSPMVDDDDMDVDASMLPFLVKHQPPQYENQTAQEASANFDAVWKSRHKRETDLWEILSPLVGGDEQSIGIVRLIADFEIVDKEYESKHVTHYTDGRFDSYQNTEFNVKTIAEGHKGTLLLKDNGKVLELNCGPPITFRALFSKKNNIGVYSVSNCFTVLKSDGQCLSWVHGAGQSRCRISKHVEKVWVQGDRFQAKLKDGRNIFLSF